VSLYDDPLSLATVLALMGVIQTAGHRLQRLGGTQRMSHTASLDAPQAPYRDPKKWVWTLSLAVPLLIGAGPLAMMLSGRPGWLWGPVVFLYVIGPLLDTWMGEDRSNPPESAVPQLEADRYYRVVTWLLVPMLWAMFVFACWFYATHELSLASKIALVIPTGVVAGFGINVGHELGHKLDRFERALALVALAPTAYGHFSIEHNRGHHRDVATPEDPASARMGESIYRFVLREMPGAFVRAWKLEASRLELRGHSRWSWRNEILAAGAITLLLWTVLVLWLGVKLLPFLLAVSFWGNFQLTTANYVEHYGLRRLKGADGRYERTTPRHSWNSNRVFSNWALFHLERHADHHAHPARRYQSLRHFDDAPQLPNGYFVMFLLAYCPPLWRRVMDPRVVAVSGGDVARVNFDPRFEARLKLRLFAS
jgi:alkane 1-monooxygenase